MRDFPRDPLSSYGHISSDAIRESVIALAEGVYPVADTAPSASYQAMTTGAGGWHVVEMLKLGAVCAFVKGLDGSDYNAALVRQGLADYGWAMLDQPSPNGAPSR